MQFNPKPAQDDIAAERAKLIGEPDQSWRADLPQRWAEFRRAQIQLGRERAMGLLELTQERIVEMYGEGPTTIKKIHNHAREELAHLEEAAKDVELIGSGAKELGDPYFCEGILRVYAQAKKVDENAKG